MRKLLLILVLIKIVFLVFTYPTYGQQNLYHSPLIGENYILFLATNKARKIEISFSFNDWKKVPMNYDEKNNIWYLIVTNNLKKARYLYMLCIDDIFVPDPLNTNTISDKRGNMISFFVLEKDIQNILINPRYIGNNLYEFFYRDINAEKVYLAGTFNNWNPFEIKLTNIGKGFWKAQIYLPPQRLHAYYFLVDGKVKLDPLNPKILFDKNGNMVNVIDSTGF